MSSSDMWQPEQPSSQTVARRGLVMAGRRLVEESLEGQERPLRLGFGDRPALLEQRPGRAHLDALAAVVHVVDSPHGVPRSVTTRASTPRPITSQVWAPSISAHTRTQRVHRMQRLWSITKRSWLASTPTSGSRPGSSKWVRPSAWAWACSSQWLLATHTEQTWLRSTKSISMIVRR